MTNKKDLTQNLIDAIARLDEDKVLAYTEEMKNTGFRPEEIQDCFNIGLKEVGLLFERGEYFIADLMFSGMLYRSVLNSLTPASTDFNTKKKARVLIGVAEKDIHDIGKSIVVGLLYADGFDVIDLGTDVTPEKFVDSIREYQPKIVLLSGMMSFARDSMKRTVDAIKAAGLRDQVFILLGGGCVDSSILDHIDADAVAIEPIDTVNSCNKFLHRRLS